MKLVPYFLQKKETPNLVVYRLTLFLMEGGKSLWEIGSETNEKVIQTEYLQENGFYTSSIEKLGDLYFAHLDPQRTSLKSFYTWEEIQESQDKKREDCFRTFTFCFEQPHEKLWFHSDICEQPFDGRKETPYALFQGLKNHCYKKV